MVWGIMQAEPGRRSASCVCDNWDLGMDCATLQSDHGLYYLCTIPAILAGMHGVADRYWTWLLEGVAGAFLYDAALCSL